MGIVRALFFPLKLIILTRDPEAGPCPKRAYPSGNNSQTPCKLPICSSHGSGEGEVRTVTYISSKNPKIGGN